jgi:type I restriction enzyme S subunit
MSVEGWQEISLGNILFSRNDKSKQIKSSEYLKNGSYPIIDQSSDFICGYCDDIKKVISNGLPYIVFGDHTRHTKFIDFPFVVGADGTQIIKSTKEVDDLFFFYLVLYAAERIGNYGYDRHFKHLKQFICDYPIDQSEQTQIATILSTIDRAIEQTEALIAKQQRIKTGLMQDLLTKGIDENGNIRSEETHEFKDSPLGRIPVEWEVKKIGEISTISYGISDAIEQSRNSGILTVTLPCVLSSGELIVKPELLAYSDENKVKQSDLLKKGDLLFNWRNGSQNHLGKTAYFNLEEKYTHVGFLLKIRTSPRLCDSRFLWYLLCDIKEKGFFQTAKIQVNNTFNSNELRKVVLFFPRIDEQKIIVKFLDSIQFAISNQSEYLTKLKSIKFGLMQDLLTGKVRVTDLLNQNTATN